jgi:hypothetical protein
MVPGTYSDTHSTGRWVAMNLTVKWPIVCSVKGVLNTWRDQPLPLPPTRSLCRGIGSDVEQFELGRSRNTELQLRVGWNGRHGGRLHWPPPGSVVNHSTHQEFRRGPAAYLTPTSTRSCRSSWRSCCLEVCWCRAQRVDLGIHFPPIFNGHHRSA